MQAIMGLRCQRFGSFEALLLLSLLCLGGTLLSFSVLFNEVGIGNDWLLEGDYDAPTRSMPTQPLFSTHGNQPHALDPSPWAHGVRPTSKPIKVNGAQLEWE